jgi:hypothetical protein
MSLADILGIQIAESTFKRLSAEEETRRCFLNKAIADAFCTRWNALGGEVTKGPDAVDERHWVVHVKRPAA